MKSKIWVAEIIRYGTKSLNSPNCMVVFTLAKTKQEAIEQISSFDWTDDVLWVKGKSKVGIRTIFDLSSIPSHVMALPQNRHQELLDRLRCLENDQKPVRKKRIRKKR